MSTLAIPTVDRDGFAPDSAYATWGDEQRAASDRVEFDHNCSRSSHLALADEQGGHPIQGYSDGMLASAAKRFRRELEDIAEGDHSLPARGPRSAKARARFINAMLVEIERVQSSRAALAEGWLAVERGTHSYSSFQARGGLAAVRDHGAAPASYELAGLLDWEQWKLGLEHALDWGAR